MTLRNGKTSPEGITEFAEVLEEGEFTYVKADATLRAGIGEGVENAALMKGMSMARAYDDMEVRLRPVDAIRLSRQDGAYDAAVRNREDTATRKEGTLPGAFTALVSMDGKKVLGVFETRVKKGMTQTGNRIVDFPEGEVIQLLEEVMKKGLSAMEMEALGGKSEHKAKEMLVQADEFEAKAKQLREQAREMMGKIEKISDAVAERLVSADIWLDVGDYVAGQMRGK